MSHINSPDHLAKTAFFTGIPDKVIHGINLLLFRPDPAVVIPKYASSTFKTQWFIDACRVFTQKAANQASINTTNLKTIRIPLPPLDIQQKIVDEIVKVEKWESEKKAKLGDIRKQITSQASNLYLKHDLQKLGSICDQPMYGANESAVNGDPEKDPRYIRITDIHEDGSLNNDWKTAERVEEKYILKE